MGHYDRYRDASVRAGEGKRLAVVAARGGDYPLYLRPLAFEPVEIVPPRTLKAPIGVWFSCFTTTSTPVYAFNSGHAYCGVGGTLARTRGITFSSSAKVNI
jgi:hypothetical protein